MFCLGIKGAPDCEGCQNRPLDFRLQRYRHARASIPGNITHSGASCSLPFFLPGLASAVITTIVQNLYRTEHGKPLRPSRLRAFEEVFELPKI
jgi:hypothetical protein